ncbi:MAG: prepilin peptidase [Polyangiaceae bacterium]|nr:prepilin peptidase [Polyangiaceae bacterium]
MLGVPYFMAFAIAVSAIAAWHDWRTGEIPDWITLGPLCAAPLAHLGFHLHQTRSMSHAIEAAGFSILGAAACAVVPLMLFRVEGMLGGDVKLLAAIGAILRPLAGVEAEFYAILAGIVIGCAQLAYEGRLLRMLGNTAALTLNVFLPKHRRRQLTPEMLTRLRFGPAIFVGTCGAALTNWRTP